MTPEVIAAEAERLLTRYAIDPPYQHDREAREWYLWATINRGAWDLVSVTITQAGSFWHRSWERKSSSARCLAGPELVPDLLAYLLMIPIETGALLQHNPHLHSLRTGIHEIDTAALGLETYWVEIENRGTPDARPILIRYTPDGNGQVQEERVYL